MRRIIYIAGVILFTLFYCFAISKIINDSLACAVNYQDSSGGERKAYFSSFDAARFYNAPRNESSLNGYENLPTLKIKNQYSRFSYVIISEEKQIKTEFIRCIFEIQHGLIRFRKANLIFPFHYFW